MVISSPASGVDTLTGTLNPTVVSGMTSALNSRFMTGIIEVVPLGLLLDPTPSDAAAELVEDCVGDGDLELNRPADDAVGLMKPCATVDILLTTYGGLPNSPSFSNDLLRSLLVLGRCGVGNPSPVSLLLNTGFSPVSLNAATSSSFVSLLSRSLSLRPEGEPLAPPLPVCPPGDVIF